MDITRLLTPIAATPTSDEMTGVLWSLLLLLIAAKIGEEVFHRLGQPSVVGQLIAGIIIGPQVLNLARPSEVTAILAELGVLFLLFLVGLETHPSELRRVGKDSFVVAVGGVVLPFVLGFGAMALWGQTRGGALFVGAAMVATSVGITASVLAGLGVLRELPGRIILGAAVIDDILGLLTLAVVGGMARGGSLDYRQVLLTVLYATLFTLFMLRFGAPAVARARPALDRLRIDESLYVAGIILCLGLAVAAGHLGVAGIIGAFLAGVAFSEVSAGTELHGRFTGLAGFFVPFFLAGIGMEINLRSLSQGHVLAMCLVVTVLAVLGKVLGCGLPLRRRDRKLAWQVGVGMVPRGEVGIIVAQLGLGLGVLNDDLFAVVMFMAVATSVIAPPLLVRLFRPAEPSAAARC